MESILTSIKKMLGPEEEYEYFDTDLIIHINSALMILNQLGVGPSEGFSIQDKTATWAEFEPNIKKIEGIKTYVYLKVKLVFDPPSNASVIKAIESQIKEFEWRLNAVADTGNGEEIQNGE